MTHSVQEHFRIEIGGYDDAIRKLIPGYEEMLRCAADAIAEVQPRRVLDLGAGTAALSEQVLLRTSEAVVELWDVDPQMLKQAAARLDRFGDRAEKRIQSYHDSFPPCDAIMASLSLHHIRSIEEKQRLYARAFDALSPGGVFVNADATMPNEEQPRRTRYRAWVDHMKSRGISEERAWQHIDNWSDEDTYFPEALEVRALESVGFRVTVSWREVISTVVVASKPL